MGAGRPFSTRQRTITPGVVAAVDVPRAVCTSCRRAPAAGWIVRPADHCRRATRAGPGRWKAEVLGGVAVAVVVFVGLQHRFSNSVRFRGKVKGTPLDPGQYALRVVADGRGRTAELVTKSFTVIAVTG